MKVNLYKIGLLIIILSIVASSTGCYWHRTINEQNQYTLIDKEKRSSTINKHIDDNSKEYVKIKFFKFEDSGGKEIKIGNRVSYSIEIQPIYKNFSKDEYEQNFSKILKNSIKEIYNIELNKIEFKEGNKLIVDINRNSVTTLNVGSTGSFLMMRMLINTFINLPNVKTVEFSLDGVKDDIYGDHFDLTGIFKKNEKGEIINITRDYFSSIVL